MTEPTVSICIPAYHSDPFLGETLESIRGQTFTDWEIVVTEDGSQDKTEEIVQTFASRVPQPVRYHRHETNRGLPAARNTGFELSRGRLIALLDADDLWLPQHLSRCIAAMERFHAEFVFSGCAIFEDDSKEILEMRTVREEQCDDLLTAIHSGAVIIQPSAVLFTRDLLQRVGCFEPAFPLCNDLEYWLRILRNGAAVAYSGADTMLYRKHEGSMSCQSAALIAETGRVYWWHRSWREIPAGMRRAAVRNHYRNAARINARTHPALACKQILWSTLAPLAIL